MSEMKDDNAVDNEELQLVVFRVGKEEFGLDVSEVKEIIRILDITPMPKAPDFIEGVINLRGQVVAVMDLASRFDLKDSKKTEKSRIVVVEMGSNIVGFKVDEVPEVLRLSTQDVDPTPQISESSVNAEFIRGIGKFDERLIIILDSGKIIGQEDAEKLQQAMK